MRIAILITTLSRGGAERAATAIANGLALMGDTIKIFKFDSSVPGYSLGDEVKYVNIVPPKKSCSIVRIIKRMSLLKSSIQEYSPDVVLCFSFKTAVYPLIMLRKRQFSVVASERSNPFYEFETKSIANKAIWRWINKHVAPTADGFVFLTQDGIDFYGDKVRKKSTVIPNALFAEDIPKEITAFEDRDFLKICATANLRKVKDYETMLHAFAIFHSNHPLHQLYILGDGEERLHLEELTSALGLGKCIHFLGNVERPVDFIKDAGMYLSTSRSESWGNGIMEALACGIPCICTDCDFGPREMITSDENGILVRVGDVEAISRAMDKVSTDRVFAMKLSNNAQDIRKRFERKRIAILYHNYLLSTTTKCL